MKYIVIGLGNYGFVLAEELASMGHEVIGADIDPARVENIKDKIATAFILDATEENALTSLPLARVDAVIVTIGENFGSSIRVVALLKQLNVKLIYARAIDDIHKSVLDAFGVEKVLRPEEDAARRQVELWEFDTEIEAFKIDENYYVMKFKVPERFIGYFLSELKLTSEFNLKLISVKRERATKNMLGIHITEHYLLQEIKEDEKIFEGDELVCFGLYKDFRSFWKAL